MKRYIIITGDSNDADYITSKKEIEEDFEEVYGELIKAIINNKNSYNWWSFDSNKEEDFITVYSQLGFSIKLIEDFSYFVPSGEYGIHTITSIEIIEVTNEEKLL